MATYYVRPVNGNDANDGLSFAAAFATTQKAADTAVAGDVVYLCAEAVESIAAKIDLDTNAGGLFTPINFVAANASGVVDGTGYTIRSDAAMTAVLDFAIACDNTIWTGIDFDANGQATYCIYNNADGSDNHQFTSCRMHGATADGIFVRGQAAVGWPLVGCEIDHNGGRGIAHAATNRGYVVCEYCRIHHNTSHGWQVDCQRLWCRRTSIYRNGGDGLLMGSTSHQMVLDGCTIYLNGGDGIKFFNDTSRNLYRISNVTCVANGAYAFRFQTGDSRVCQYFDYVHTHGNVSGAGDIALPGTHNVTGDPLFASVVDGAEDFTPAYNSPLVGNGLMGTTIGALPAVLPTPAEIAAAIWTREGRSLTP